LFILLSIYWADGAVNRYRILYDLSLADRLQILLVEQGTLGDQHVLEPGKAATVEGAYQVSRSRRRVDRPVQRLQAALLRRVGDE
jgi:hypothetical protein